MKSSCGVDFKKFVPKFDAILAKGLSQGLGSRDSQVCIEAAVCAALDLPHGDDPKCVSEAVRSFKIRLNDANWSSPQARAKGLRALGIAQVGSKGVVDDVEFAKRVAEQTIRVLIPKLFRSCFKGNVKLEELADRCEKEGTEDAARAAAWAAEAAARAAAAAASAAEAAASAAAWAADEYLILSANIALSVLRELKSPGCEYV